MAGVRIKALSGVFGEKTAAARAMPNMGALVGEGMTCVAFNAFVKNKKEVLDIFAAVGEVSEVEETCLDAVTALSGSGPAYLFYLADSLVEAGTRMGLSSVLASELAVQTLYGAAVILKEKRGEGSPLELIRAVASKGGTTEAALNVLNGKNVKKYIIEAVESAKKRAEELAGG
jgi:pyrroline-5-carboxylate reductase